MPGEGGSGSIHATASVDTGRVYVPSPAGEPAAVSARVRAELVTLLDRLILSLLASSSLGRGLAEGSPTEFPADEMDTAMAVSFGRCCR